MMMIVLLDFRGLWAPAPYTIQKSVACQARWLGASGSAILTDFGILQKVFCGSPRSVLVSGYAMQNWHSYT